MCLIYELLILITKKFFSLNTLCRAHMNRIIETCITYIDQVDDENFLTQLMLEKDYSNRDSLRIATDLELLEIIQSPKVEAIILRIYNSDFDQAGDLFEVSTTYQICFASKYVVPDPERPNRFYNKRETQQLP